MLTETQVRQSEQERLKQLFNETKPDRDYFDPDEFKIPDDFEFRMTHSVFLFQHKTCGKISEYIIGGSPKFYGRIEKELEAHSLACKIAKKSEVQNNL